jgi:hypothetical protein
VLGLADVGLELGGVGLGGVELGAVELVEVGLEVDDDDDTEETGDDEETVGRVVSDTVVDSKGSDNDVGDNTGGKDILYTTWLAG